LIFCSAIKGKSVHLLKANAKRRKTKTDIEVLEHEAMLVEGEKTENAQELLSLRAENNLLKQNNDNGVNATKILNDLLQKGELVQDGDGEISVAESQPPSDSQSERFLI